MKINRIIAAALLLGVTAAYADDTYWGVGKYSDKYTVDIYNFTPYEGSRKVTTQTALAKDSKFRRLPPHREVTNPTGTATSQRTIGLPQKEYEPGHSEWQVKTYGALLDKVIVKLKATPGSTKYTQEVSYNIPADLAGKHWKFLVFQDPQTQAIQMCGFSKAPEGQRTSVVANLFAAFPAFVGYSIAGAKHDVAVEKALKATGLSSEWSQRACENFK